MRVAITRAVSDGLSRCELTHLSREPIDIELAREQHAQYEAVLERLGCRIERLPSDPNLPDSVFVEDTAVVVDEVAVLTRPGAVSRRLEVEPIAALLARHRALLRIEPPGTLDGGDILVVGRTVYAGLSGRTSAEGIVQLRQLLRRFAYEVKEVAVNGCLHLKSAVSAVDDHTVLINPAWVDPGAFTPMEAVPIDPQEPFAANALRIGEVLVYRSAYPRTLRILEQRGLRVATVDLSELAKAEGAVTCCSLILEHA